MKSPIEEKAEWAEEAYLALGESLRNDPPVAKLLSRIEECFASAMEAMEASGIVEACRRCDTREGGSCCARGIDDRYDGVLLLINRLLQVPLPMQRKSPKDCLFLGKMGCRLKARHVICVNYLCKEAQEAADPELMAAMRDREGEALEAIFLLHDLIKRQLCHAP